MSEVTIAFLGATDTVTGSRFLVTSAKSKVLVDCGLFQGIKSIRKKNWDPFPVDVKTIDSVVLTHAHLDHCGYLPLLARQGFVNPIFATNYTAELVSVILHDSAHLQMEDAKYAAKKGYSKHEIPLPLYTVVDAEKVLTLVKRVAFHARVQVAPDAFVTWFPAGHILGAAFILLEIADKKLLFTGDLGRNNHPLLSNPDNPPLESMDAVITESTYGDRKHDAKPEDFARELNAAIQRGGSILIPAFAVDRTEVILMALRDLMEKKLIPLIPIYVDSPMALAALNFYRQAITTDSAEIRDGVSDKWANQDPFDAGKLMQALTTEESKQINDVTETSIIISASGMATGGRVVHHLEHMLPDPKNTVILVGYQAAGSRGRLLEEGVAELKMHGKLIPVRANIAKVESFSVHADADEIIQWLGKAPKPGKVFVIHGEQGAQEVMADRLVADLGWNAIVPKPAQVISI
ncbi:YSH1 Predicted exonuclease of the beta-lactamase fold involved in RNA processing [Candidatus Nanopelagicaceae bacterium]